jgi:cytochrome c oxidase subunit II
MISQYLEAGSTYAGDIDNIIWWILIIVGFWFLLAEAVFIGLILKFSHKEGVRPQYITGEKPQEMRWVAWPHYATLIFDVIILVAAIRVWTHVKIETPPIDVTVRAVAQQWAWTFTHPGPDLKLDTPDDIRLVDELHVEKGKTYSVEMMSRDVLHSFSVPVFRLKQDVIPGRVIKGWFTPTLTGQFDIQCTEICGIGHALMPGRIFVEDHDAHQRWMRSAVPVATTTPGAPPAPATGGIP